MTLSPEIMDALRRERDSLMAQRNQIDREIAALDAILRPTALPATGHLFPPAMVVKPSHKKTTATTGAGLRDVIRASVNKNPSGVTIDDVVSEAERIGIKPSGSTKLRVLATSDLWRLAKSGEIRKVGKRYYASGGPQ